jgi:flagellar protein FlbD
MIRLTHLTGEPFLLNAELIRYVEARPDTFITLTTGDRMVVHESMDEVLERTLAYQQSKYFVPPPRANPFRENAARGSRETARPDSPSLGPAAIN